MVDEKQIIEFLRFKDYNERGFDYQIHRHLTASTRLILLKRIKNWDALNSGFGYTTIHFESIIEEIPQEFLELILERMSAGINHNVSTIISLLGDSRTQEDTVFLVANLALDIEENEESERKKHR